MSEIVVYDRPLCCSTGVCGPQVDPALVQFAADLDGLKRVGHHVVRWNLAQEPNAFLQNHTVQQFLTADGVECLPLILVNGQIVSRGTYPPRGLMESWLSGGALASVPGPAKKLGLPILGDGSSFGAEAAGEGACCSGPGCC